MAHHGLNIYTLSGIILVWRKSTIQVSIDWNNFVEAVSHV